MTMSKRLALLGSQYVARTRGHGSSYALIDRRLFPYRQFSDLSKNSQMETAQDLKMSILKSELETSQENHSILVKREIQKLRHDMEMMQMEQRYEAKKSNLEFGTKLQEARREYYESEFRTLAWLSTPMVILCILVLFK
ncbi:hypothetical protein ISN44_As08g035070 [Arabidopsis suecica]|uniref:Uncharacterized protein n=1 Tax=Arabidopsis suecica TaxID=45249 RepID=A0A8T2BFR6_ARASU|nr:hypothetical protein ISN44_As08g035070 [Arabidopsis suecica]